MRLVVLLVHPEWLHSLNHGGRVEAHPENGFALFHVNFGVPNEGIELVQALSANNWTDYNLHDPGVTILEQLCFALTELGYRAGFPVKDQLAETNQGIDWEKLEVKKQEDAAARAEAMNLILRKS